MHLLLPSPAGSRWLLLLSLLLLRRIPSNSRIVRIHSAVRLPSTTYE